MGFVVLSACVANATQADNTTTSGGFEIRLGANRFVREDCKSLRLQFTSFLVIFELGDRSGKGREILMINCNIPLSNFCNFHTSYKSVLNSNSNFEFTMHNALLNSNSSFEFRMHNALLKYNL